MPIMLPAEMLSTRSVITNPNPVIDTVPTTIPAAAVAIAMPIMLRAPAPSPSMRSFQPARRRNSGETSLRNIAIKGFCVSSMMMSNAVA